MPAKIERPVRITISLTEQHGARLEALAAAMAQPVGTAAGVAVTLGLNALEQMYGLNDSLQRQVQAMMEPKARQAALEMAQAGLPMRDVPEE